MKKTGKKGSTLAELCVVLGLVTIIGAMVVSFAVMMSQRTQLSAARLDVINEIEVVESITETWLGQMELLGATLSVEDQMAYNELCATIDPETEESYTLSYKEGVLKATLPDGGEMTFAPKRLLSMEFGIKVPEDVEADQVEEFIEKFEGAHLYFYALVYEIPGNDGGLEQYAQMFFVNPHVGDIYAGGGGVS